MGEPFTADEARELILPALEGCEWVILGGQCSTDFPPETIAVLSDAGLQVCIDAQGLARGPDPGPLRLRAFPPAAVAGARVVKLARGEAIAVCGSDEPEAVRALDVPEIAVTRGVAGATIVTPDAEYATGPRAAAFDDPTGAGDSWLAVYVLERSRGVLPGEAALAAAAAVDRIYAG